VKHGAVMLMALMEDCSTDWKHSRTAKSKYFDHVPSRLARTWTWTVPFDAAVRRGRALRTAEMMTPGYGWLAAGALSSPARPTLPGRWAAVVTIVVVA
jgi:hypothetical protein